MLRSAFIIMVLWGYSLQAATPWDPCVTTPENLDWTSMQPSVMRAQRFPPSPAAEKVVRDQFHRLTDESSFGKPRDAGALLALTQDTQNSILNTKRYSKTLELHWIALLLTTGQNDVALKVLERSPTRPHDLVRSILLSESLFRLKRYRDAEGVLDKIRPQDPELNAFLNWRKAQLRLMVQDTLGAQRFFARVLASPLATEARSDIREALERDLIRFGQTRIDPKAFWQKIPPGLNNERLALCILTFTQSPAAAKQEAKNRLVAIRHPTDASMSYYRMQIAAMIASKPTVKGRIDIIHASLQSIARHGQGQSRARLALLAEVLKLSQILAEELMRYPGGDASKKQLLTALALFIEQSPEGESQMFRRIRAPLLENMGQWRASTSEYTKIFDGSKDVGERKTLVASALRVAAKAAPLLPASAKPLRGAELEAARDQVQTCERFYLYWPHAAVERRACESYAIQLALNQRDWERAERLLWLHITNHPKDAHESVAALLTLHEATPGSLISTCEKLLRIPDFQVGSLANYLRDRKRQARFAELGRIKNPSDQAAAYASFAQDEQPAPLALEAIRRALNIAAGRWEDRARYLRISLEKFPMAPERMENYLKLAELYEENFALTQAYELLRSTRQLSWRPDLADKKNRLECRLGLIDNPLDAVASCLVIARTDRSALRELTQRLAWAKEITELSRLTSPVVLDTLAVSVDEKIELLGIAYEASTSYPDKLQTIKSHLYELYEQDPSVISAESRRILAAIAYEAAQKDLPAYLNMPIYAANIEELPSAIQGKHAAFREIEQLYAKVLGTKDSYWGASALADLASASLNLSDSLKAIVVEGYDPKVLEAQLLPSVGQWATRSKAYAVASERTLEQFGVLHAHARRLKLDMQSLRADEIRWTDAIPPWELAYAH